MKWYLEDNNKAISNKGMGWVSHVYCGDTVDYNDVEEVKYVDNVALLYTWSEIEIEEGVFDFSKIDEKIEKYTSRGQYIHFRISTDPMIYNGAKGVPNWVFEKYNVKYFERDDYGCVAKFPDYLDKNYQRCLKNFLDKMAEKYGDNKNILQIDLRGYGEWGEWHSGYLHENLATHNEALKQIIDIWAKAFEKTNIPLAISSSYEWRSDLKFNLHAPRSFDEYKYYQGFDTLENYPNITFRRDGIAGALRVYDKQIIDEHYKNGKYGITAEFFSTYLKSKEMPDGVRGYHTLDALEEAFQIHPNYMMFMWDSNQFYNERFDLVEYGLKRMGFRLLPKEIEIDQINKTGYTTIKQCWINTGSGKLDYDAALHIELVSNSQTKKFIDKSFNPKRILDKEYNHITNVSFEGLSGEVEVYISLVDNEGKKLNLPLDGTCGRYKVCTLNI